MRGNLKKIITGLMIFMGLVLVKHFIFFDVYDKEMSEALKVRQEIVDGFKTPPMPDRDLNDKDVLGVDLNNNGIRDDIEIWINYVGKNYNERMALRQLASDLQYEAKVFSGDINARIVSQVVSIFVTSNMCVIHVFGYEKARYVKNKMKELYKNTIQRERVFNRDNEFSYGFGPLKGIKKNEDACLFQLK